MASAGLEDQQRLGGGSQSEPDQQHLMAIMVIALIKLPV